MCFQQSLNDLDREGCVQFADFKEFVHSIIRWKGSNFLSCFYCVFLRTGCWDQRGRIPPTDLYWHDSNKIIAFKSRKTNQLSKTILIYKEGLVPEPIILWITKIILDCLLSYRSKSNFFTFWFVFQNILWSDFHCYIFSSKQKIEIFCLCKTLVSYHFLDC